MICELKEQALDELDGKWGLAVGATLFIIFPFVWFWGWSRIIESFMIDIIVIVMIGPLTLGAYYLALNTVREKAAGIGQLFRWCKAVKKFIKSILILVLMDIYITLWTMLFIIPGIVKLFSYTMTFFILNDHPEFSMNRAITESRRIMKGHKREYFLICLSFIGWFILSIVTFGIGFLWLIPYFYTTKAAFYEKVSQDYYKRKSFVNIQKNN
ncbi:DUF975 family protein [Bacillus cereus]|uniref:DUF975 family protein n=1 Tax=Bacillus cereus TaxID=1396 RepID=A0AA44Q916_BACCE|nr:DUF975 family protein [Bacillus cereus]PFN07355.1 hypothetical protein COJ55_10985 [Bacillus cereus]PFR99577.1 hypothetical protein COK38_15245 [Bacillus cereus]PGZ17562.1 hypothetical protein COE46_08640 [Bacillus cereus]